MAHPPPPWHLFGELIIVPALVRPRALGGVMLANYTSGTLVYRELIVFDRATPRGMVVSHIYVDDEQSLSGGREIWGLPKELAEFEYSPKRFAARQNGSTLLEATIRRKPGRLPLLIPAPIVSEAGATLESLTAAIEPVMVRELRTTTMIESVVAWPICSVLKVSRDSSVAEAWRSK